MATYYTAETDAAGHVNTQSAWAPCGAKTMASAKRAASRARVFQATAAHVGTTGADGAISSICVNRPCSAIDAASRRRWNDFENAA